MQKESMDEEPHRLSDAILNEVKQLDEADGAWLWIMLKSAIMPHMKLAGADERLTRLCLKIIEDLELDIHEDKLKELKQQT